MKALLLIFAAGVSLNAATLELVVGSGMGIPPCKAREVQLREPFGVEFTPSGEMIIVEMSQGERVLRLDRAGVVQHIAGTGSKGFAGDGGDPKQAQFNGVHNLAVLPDGTVLLADSWNQRIRRLDPKLAKIDTWAGNGKKAFEGDGGPAINAAFGMVIQITADPKSEFVYVADIASKRVRRINVKSGIVETVAGNGKGGAPADGAKAVESPLSDPRAVVPDKLGGFYVLERGGNALRYVDNSGVIKTVAGNGKQGLSGDGGPALAASLNGPKHACLDRDGTVIIADAENHVIRRFDPKSGAITRVAGTGQKGSAGIGGDPLKAELNRPHGVTIGPDGALFIVDSYNNRILKLAP
jgi:DNA-binding beta-propeller fold protein YncE